MVRTLCPESVFGAEHMRIADCQARILAARSAAQRAREHPHSDDEPPDVIPVVHNVDAPPLVEPAPVPAEVVRPS